MTFVAIGALSVNVFAQGHITVTPVRLKNAAPLSGVKHSTTEPLHSHSSM